MFWRWSVACLFWPCLNFSVKWGCRVNANTAWLLVQSWCCFSLCQLVSNEMTCQHSLWNSAGRGPVPGGSTVKTVPEFLQLQHFRLPSSHIWEPGVCTIRVLWKHASGLHWGYSLASALFWTVKLKNCPISSCPQKNPQTKTTNQHVTRFVARRMSHGAMRRRSAVKCCVEWTCLVCDT